jgi:hypothetical protein
MDLSCLESADPIETKAVNTHASKRRGKPQSSFASRAAWWQHNLTARIAADCEVPTRAISESNQYCLRSPRTETGSNRRRRPFQSSLLIDSSALESADVIETKPLVQCIFRIVWDGFLPRVFPHSSRLRRKILWGPEKIEQR